VLVFPEPPSAPPPFDRKKKIYPSKANSGTEGCPDFHQFVQSNA
jgi:hypothetical protein